MSVVKTRSAAFAALLVAAALLLAGCGGGGEDSESTETTEASTTQSGESSAGTQASEAKQGKQSASSAQAAKQQRSEEKTSSAGKATKHGERVVLPEGEPEPVPTATQRAQATVALILLVLAREPVDEALFFNWAVAGIDPASTAIESGELPAGAVIGRNSFGRTGYSICPPNGPETYLFALYALPEQLNAAKGFDPAALREKALGASGGVGLLAVVGG